MATSTTPRSGMTPLAMDIDLDAAASRKPLPSSKSMPGNGTAQHSASMRARCSYAPQFSTSSSFILGRMGRQVESSIPISSAVSLADSRSNKENPNSVEMQPKQSMDDFLTMPLPTPANFTPTSSFLGKSVPLSAASLKRKRESDLDIVDFSQNTISFPTPTHDTPPMSGTLPATEPREASSQSCSVCNQTDSPPQNLLLTCGRCLSMWHQQCATPQISDEASKSVGFECSECIKEAAAQRASSDNAKHRRDRVEAMCDKRLSQLPQGVSPAKPELVGFGAGQSSSQARTEYFYTKKKTDLLNILSFCDQLQPQLLVDILVSVSKRHPDLPLFDSPDWENRLPSAGRTGSPSAIPKARSENKHRHGHSLVVHKIKQKQRSSKKAAKASQVVQVGREIIYEDEDALPPTWHKAGDGMYAKLVPEVDDKTFLVDENDEEAFSQFMVDSSGRQIIETALDRKDAVVT